MPRRPVAAFTKIGGFYFLPRTFDKIRVHARGELHPDHHEFLGKGFDGRLCHFLGIGYEALRLSTLAGGTDEEMLHWIRERWRKTSEVDLLIWNGVSSKRRWRDDATPNLEKQKAESGLAHRTDLVTFFDYYEVDEGHAPR